MSWQQVQDDQGRTYYYNSQTQETSWTNPEAALPWKTFSTEDGKEYYYNESTGETTWDKPEEPKAEAEENTPSYSDVDQRLATEPIAAFGAESPALAGETPENSKEERFLQMLRAAGVDATWSFEKVIQTFVQHPVYWQIDDAVARRDLYEEYLVKKLEAESSSEVEILENLRKSFRAEIERHFEKGEIKETTRWSSLKNKLIQEENPIFKHSILPDHELEKIYAEFVQKVESGKKEKLQHEKKQALAELEGYLVQITDDDGIRWEQLYERLQNDARFKANKHFSVLSKVDMLEVYAQNVHPLIVERIKAKIAAASLVNRRTDMKAREHFRKLLALKKIRANTSFSELNLENEDAYMELCGRQGSNPLQLFWDIVEEQKQQVKVKKDLVEQTLKDAIEQGKVKSSFGDVLSGDFLKTLQLLDDKRLGILLLDTEDGKDEASVILDMLKTEFRVQRERMLLAHEETLRQLESALGEWILQNLGTCEVVREKGPERKGTVVDLESATVVTMDIDLETWEEKLSAVSPFQALVREIGRLHAGEEKKRRLASSLEKSVQSVVEHAKKRALKKRPAPEPAGGLPKRGRPDEEKQPILMNY